MKQLVFSLNIAFIAFLLYLIYKKYNKTIPKQIILLTFASKILCAILLGIIYFEFYGMGDTCGYQWDSIILTEIAKRDFNLYLRLIIDHESVKFTNQFHDLYINYYWSHKAFTVAKIVSVLNFATLSNYWLNATYFSILGIYASLFICEKFDKIYPKSKTVIYSSFIFFPSILFWTSGLMKETIAVSLIFLFVGSIIEMKLNSIIFNKYLVVILLSGIGILYFKYYIAAIFFPFLFFYLLIEKLKITEKAFFKVGLNIVLTFISYYILNFVAYTIIDPHLKLELLPQVFFDSYHEVIYFSEKYSETLNYNKFANFNPSYSSLLQNAPEIIFKGLFYPTVLHDCNLFQRIYSIENTFKLMVVLVAFIAIFYNNPLKNDVLFWVFLFIILMASLIISASCPNWGSISRLKSYYVPFLTFYSLFLVTNFVKKVFLKMFF